MCALRRGAALAVVRGLECSGDCGNSAACAHTKWRLRMGICPRLAANHFLRHRLRGSVLPLARLAWRVAKPDIDCVGGCCVCRASGGVAAEIFVALAYGAPCVWVLKFLSALSRSGRSVLGVAGASALHRCIPPNDRCAQRWLFTLLRDIPAVPHSQSIA